MPFLEKIVITIVSALIKKKYGKVFSHMGMIYSKKLPLLFLADKITSYEEKKIKLSEELVLLIKTYASLLNGCSFCEDLALAIVIRKEIGEKKFLNLSGWETCGADIFSHKDRAVLKFIQEYSQGKSVQTETMSKLRSYFSEEEVIDIVTTNAIENFYNALSIPFGIRSDGLAQIARSLK